jgi:hypothetical protein
MYMCKWMWMWMWMWCGWRLVQSWLPCTNAATLEPLFCKLRGSSSSMRGVCWMFLVLDVAVDLSQQQAGPCSQHKQCC